MIHKTRQIALSLITRTPLEPFARKLYAFIVPSKGNEYDRQTFEVIKRSVNENSSCIDIGAYRGEILNEIVKISPKGKHYAFEPVPENFHYVKNKYPKVKVLNLALSDKSGKVTFNHVVGRPARSGLIEVEYPDKNQRIEKINVKVTTLDKAIPKKQRIDLVKIDVEGAEFGVLKGGKSLILRDKPVIIFEHELDKAKKYKTGIFDVYDFLVKDCGMAIYTLGEYLNSGKHISRAMFGRYVKTHDEFYFVAKAVK